MQKIAITTTSGLFQLPFMSFAYATSPKHFSASWTHSAGTRLMFRLLGRHHSILPLTRRAQATPTSASQPTWAVRDPKQTSEICLSSIRGHLPRLQGARRRFPTTGRTNGPSPGLPLPKTASKLRRYHGMLNFYRRFLPQAAVIHATLHDVFSSPESRALIQSTGHRT
jgi:hypothetical protein